MESKNHRDKHSQSLEESLSDSDEDGVLNAVGDIPTEWYRDFPHIGYDLEGKRVLKPASGDQLDKFLEGVEDPSGLWKSVRMPDLPGTDLLLSEKEMEMVQRIQKADYPDSEFHPYPLPSSSTPLKRWIRRSLELTSQSAGSFLPSGSTRR